MLMMTNIDFEGFIQDNPITEEIKNQLKAPILKDITHFLLNNPKYIWTVTPLDDRRDYSGETRKISEHFIASVYDTVGEFLEEYTGNTNATYTSHHGWHHDSLLDDLSYAYSICFSGIYSHYYDKLIKEKLGLDEYEDYSEEFHDAITNPFELQDEICKIPLAELVKHLPFDHPLFQFDRIALRKEVLDLLVGYDENSTVLVVEFTEVDPITHSFTLGDILTKEGREKGYPECIYSREFDPSGEYISFQYLLNDLFNAGKDFTLTLKTPVENDTIEMRSILYKDQIPLKISAAELERAYSTDSTTLKPITPPRGHVFKEYD